MKDDNQEKKRVDKGAHYRFEYRGIKLDPARICQIYGVVSPTQSGIIKKALVAGKRGKKTIKEDIEDIINSAERWLEMIEEDEMVEREEQLKKQLNENKEA